jgi:3,4-dihydroxy 2-butanone 4-phosphate synthase
MTIKEMAQLYGSDDAKNQFTTSFVTPGHVPLLLASNGLLTKRQGHTEMSVYLTQLANLTPVTAICEMMDSQTYSAFTPEKAQKFAKENAIPFIDGKELLEYAKVH